MVNRKYLVSINKRLLVINISKLTRLPVFKHFTFNRAEYRYFLYWFKSCYNKVKKKIPNVAENIKAKTIFVKYYNHFE